MLVVISDIHLSDGTASAHHVDPRAFRLLLTEIYRRAADCLPEGDEERRRIDIALLGDVFDLLRTERWFEDEGGAVPLRERPWSAAAALDGAPPGEAALGRARAITARIISENDAALRLLRGEGLEALLPPATQVRRLYLPGNHDRLFLHDAGIRAQILGALGAQGASDGGEGHHPHRIEMPRYGLLARHGHEWDPWNFELGPRDPLPLLRGAPEFPAEAYLRAPIGDPITAELVARLPYELRRRLREHPGFSGSEALDHVYRRLQLIEDVRPLLSSLQWVFYEADRLGAVLDEAQAQALGEALSDTLFCLADDFLRLDFYRAWRERHDRLGLDLSDGLDLMLRAVRQLPRLDLRDVGRALSVIEPLGRRLAELGAGGDPLLRGAGREALDVLGGRGQRFVVYGHTHEPAQAGLRRGHAADLYLNSGTWRERQYATQDGRGFVGWQHFSYLVFYDEDERPFGAPPTREAPRRGPAYEWWMGTRSKGT